MQLSEDSKKLLEKSSIFVNYHCRAVVNELVETEQEFVKDLSRVVQNYLIPSESGKVPKIIKDNFDVIFNNFKEIAEFHRTYVQNNELIKSIFSSFVEC